MHAKAKYLFSEIEKRYPVLALLLIKLFNKCLRITCKYRITGSNNKICNDGAILNSVNFDIIGNNNTISIGYHTVLKGLHFRIRGSGHSIKIGINCRFNERGTLWLQENNGSIQIGNKTTIQNAHIAVTGPSSEIRIGEDCLFAYDIDIRTGDSHSIICSKTGKRLNYSKNIRIGDHVWIASHVIILKGVCVGKNSVIATGSVVTKSCGEGVIMGGNPAMVIKKNINWDRKLYDKKTN